MIGLYFAIGLGAALGIAGMLLSRRGQFTILEREVPESVGVLVVIAAVTPAWPLALLSLVWDRVRENKS